jgi:hypothetical protein
MAFLTCWHMTNLPTEIVEIVEKDLQTFDSIAARLPNHGIAGG